MIRVRCLGHIKTSLGGEDIELAYDELEVGAVVEKLRGLCKEANPGFNKFNTLIMVEDGEAFVPASSSRKVRSGEKVVLIPFSHGG